MSKKKAYRGAHPPMPRTIPSGFFIWHNHIMHTNGMGHGMNGFRYRFEAKPVNYRQFMPCKCGWSGLPHYSIRSFGPQKCFTTYQMLRRACGMTAEKARAAIKHLKEAA
jgi:hypothetical protein